MKKLFISLLLGLLFSNAVFAKNYWFVNDLKYDNDYHRYSCVLADAPLEDINKKYNLVCYVEAYSPATCTYYSINFDSIEDAKKFCREYKKIVSKLSSSESKYNLDTASKEVSVLIYTILKECLGIVPSLGFITSEGYEYEVWVHTSTE